jgi:hypothetical protein
MFCFYFWLGLAWLGLAWLDKELLDTQIPLDFPFTCKEVKNSIPA